MEMKIEESKKQQNLSCLVVTIKMDETTNNFTAHHGNQDISSDEKTDDSNGSQNSSTVELKCSGDSGIILGESKQDSISSGKDDGDDSIQALAPTTLKKEEIQMENKGSGVENKIDGDKAGEKHSVERVMRFLKDPSIVRLSPSTKESYLRSKGISDDVIQTAMLKILYEDETTKLENSKGIDDIWENDLPPGQTRPTKNPNSQHPSLNSHHANNVPFRDPNYNPHMNMNMNQRYQQQQQQEQYHHPQNFMPEAQQQQQQQPLPELPNPIVPMTIGGIITLFGMAAFRWLNGDDFVLFPPSQSSSTAIDSGNNLSPQIESGVLSNHDVKNDIIEASHEQIPGEEDDIHDIDGNDILPDNQISQQDYNQGDHRLLHQESFNGMLTNKSTMMLSNDLKNLSLAIETFTALQEKNIKAKSDEKAREKTNSAMELLKKKNSPSTDIAKKDVHIDPIVIENCKTEKSEGAIINLSVLVQITEFKCAIKTLSDQLATLNASEQSKDKIFDDDRYSSILGKLDEITAFLKDLHDTIVPAKDETHEKGTDSAKCIDIGDDTKDLDSKLTQESFDKNNNETVDEVLETDGKEKEEDVTSSNKQPNSTNQELPSEEKCSSDDKKVDVPPADKETTEHTVGKEALLQALQKLQSSNETNVVKSCAQMLFLYMSNLSTNPKSKQYRKIYTNSKTFKNKVGEVKFAKDVLFSVGFVDEGKTFLEWKNDSDMEAAITFLKEAASLLKKVKAGETISESK